MTTSTSRSRRTLSAPHGPRRSSGRCSSWLGASSHRSWAAAARRGRADRAAMGAVPRVGVRPTMSRRDPLPASSSSISTAPSSTRARSSSRRCGTRRGGARPRVRRRGAAAGGRRARARGADGGVRAGPRRRARARLPRAQRAAARRARGMRRHGGRARPAARRRAGGSAIVTAKRRSTVELAFARVPLAHLFETVVGGDETERHKPDPEPLLLAAERMERRSGADGVRRRLALRHARGEGGRHATPSASRGAASTTAARSAERRTRRRHARRSFLTML